MTLVWRIVITISVSLIVLSAPNALAQQGDPIGWSVTPYC